jgi:integrase
VAYQPRPDDKTVGEVVAEVTAEKIAALVARGRTSERATAYVAKNYGHVFKALGELLGNERPAREALTREGVKAVQALLLRLPANGTKFYPKLSLIEQAEAGAKDKRPLMAPITRRNYLANLSALCNVAVRAGWIDSNPASEFIGPRIRQVKRRGYTPDELRLLFDALEPERGGDRWWLLAILTFSGARANEIAQLRTADVKRIDGVDFLDLSRFDAEGRADAGKSLKTASSERSIPLHSEIIKAGFLDFVEAARAAGRERLFPSFALHPSGTHTHEVSKWYGGFRARIGLTSPATNMHSLRHGFRDAGRRAGLGREVIDALGGWAARDVGERYGDRHAVAANAVHMEKIAFGGFSLAPASGAAGAVVDE